MKRDDRNLEPLDAILRRGSALAPGPATPECADPEMLAAYYDRSLDTSERNRLDAHFADCARCQMQLATIARADQRAGKASPPFGLAWLRKWQVAIPALAAVAAVVVFIAVMGRGNDESRRDLQIAMAKREAPLMDLAARAPAPASAPKAEVASAPESATNGLAMKEAKPEVAPGAPERRKELNQGYAAKSIGRSGALAGGQKTQSLRANAYSRAAGGDASAIGGAVGAPQTLVMISPLNRPAISAQTAGPTWMAGKRGMILMRDANGSTHSQHSGVETDLTAGAAPSAKVCWIVGRSGTIVRTTDGENWTKVASPTDADLTAVTAASAEHAVVTTAAGENFATTDGGTSWNQE